MTTYLSSSLSHLPRTTLTLMLTSVKPQRCQPSPLPYPAYLDIYFLHLSVSRVAKPLLALVPQAGCLSSEGR